jgi:hypothetical protein
MRPSFGTFFSVALASVLLARTTAASAQESENRQVVVRAEAEELPSAYGAPPDLSHGRILLHFEPDLKFLFRQKNRHFDALCETGICAFFATKIPINKNVHRPLDLVGKVVRD